MALVLGTVGWSYGRALTRPGELGPAVRTVEWVRGHGGGGLVALAEGWWYGKHPPPVGGAPPPGAIPPPPPPRPVAMAGPHLPPPPPVPPIVTPALPGEGRWHPVGPRVMGAPAVYEAFLRPDPVHTSLVTGVAWMDPKLLRARLFAGLYQPGDGPWAHQAPMPPRLRPGLVAAFNSGFKLSDAHGGYYADGRTAKALVPGAASLVIHKNGTATVGAWGTQVRMGPQVAAVRQNLTLIVDHGHRVPGLAAGPATKWGATVANKALVWRSGVGVTARGALVYAAGRGLSVSSLAAVLSHAGAVRAMELDINSVWTSFFSFDRPLGRPASAANGHKLLATMLRPPSRYLGPAERDFVAMFAR